MKNTKLLLINPPYLVTPGKFNAVYTEPPLGVAYLAAYVREYNKNVDIKIIDAATMQYDLYELESFIFSEQPDIVGVSVVTFTANFAQQIFDYCKSLNTKILTVAGGCHPTALPFDLHADINVVGEGEVTLKEVVEYKQGLRDISEINGIAYRNNGVETLNQARSYTDVDTIPFPAWDLLPMDRYSHQYPYKTRNKKYATLITARGCPYNCRFCGVKNMWGKQVRYRNTANVIKEIQTLVEKYDVSFLYIFDDTFTIRRARVVELCNEIKKFGIKWACFSRVDLIDRELLRTMKAAGCVEIQFGVESGNPDILRSIKKGISLEEAEKAFRYAREIGINTKGFFMIGNDGETVKTVNDTINVAVRLNPTYGFFSILIPFPGLPIHEEYKNKGYIKTFDWDKYNWYGYPVFETPDLSAEQMKALQRKAEIKFHLRPQKIVKYAYQTIKSGKVKTLIRNGLAFVNILSFKDKKEASK